MSGTFSVRAVLTPSDDGIDKADSALLDEFRERRLPSNQHFVNADVFFTCIIDYLNSILLNFQPIPSDVQLIRFVINRAFECKKWLLKNYYKLTEFFYHPVKPNNLVIPPLDPTFEKHTLGQALEARPIREHYVPVVLLQNRMLNFLIGMLLIDDPDVTQDLVRTRALIVTLDLDVYNPNDIYLKLVHAG